MGTQVLLFKPMAGMHRYRADEFDGKFPCNCFKSNALSDGSYAKLSLAFAANANLQTSKKHCGNLNYGNTTEISTATLNQGA
jgi:hypothetical protein